MAGLVPAIPIQRVWSGMAVRLRLIDVHQCAARIAAHDCGSKERVMWWNDYWAMPWMFFGPMTMVIFVIVCFALVFFMMRGMKNRLGGPDPLDILKERYARGEIDKAEYETRRAVLGSG